jgi:hypothetical protein
VRTLSTFEPELCVATMRTVIFPSRGRPESVTRAMSRPFCRSASRPFTYAATRRTVVPRTRCSLNE